MKRLLFVAFIFVLASCSPRATFVNPVIDSDWPDPTCIFNDEDGYYYCTATGWNREFLKSKDLVNWEPSGVRPFTEQTVAEMKQLGNSCWAPQFGKVGDKYMLYLTIRSECEDSRIVSASSDKVTGPYTFNGVITDGLITGIKDTIDPFVFTDGNTGKVWLVYGSVGGIHQIELNAEGTAPAEGAVYRHLAGCDIDNDRQRLTVYEGSYVHYRDGWWYLFCSSGEYNSPTYAIGVGRSRSPEGPFLTKDGSDMADGRATVILSTSSYEHFYGPGHNGEIITDDKGNDYIIYHVHVGNYLDDRMTRRYIPRPMNLQQIYWDSDGWPYFKQEELAGGFAPAL